MKTLYRIDDGSRCCLYHANSIEDAAHKYYTDHSPDVIVECSQVLTDQGYPIVKLKDIEPGSYFHRITKRDGEYCEHSVVWCKGEYDRSTKKWFCHKFEDVNHSRLLKGEELVTIDFTF